MLYCTHGRETSDLPGKEVIDRSTNEDVDEEPFTGKTATFTYSRIVLAVECVEKCAVDQIGGPNHRWRRYEEAASNATHREPNKLRRHDQEPLV